jgi:alpha-L-fucosidase
MPWETCMTLNDHWGYYRGDHNFKPWQTVATALMNCVSQNGNLLMNIGPDSNGELPEETRRILAELADWNKNAELAWRGAGIAQFTPPAGTLYTWKDGTLYLYLMQKPMGDILLPGLRGKIKNATLLRDGSPVRVESVWGLELLEENEQRIRCNQAVAGDIIKLELIHS